MTDKMMLEALGEVMRIARAQLLSECNAAGQSGNGHNADWCAGWNAHNLKCAQDSNRLKALEQAFDELSSREFGYVIQERAAEIMRGGKL